MKKWWTIWLSNGFEVYDYYIDNYDNVLWTVQNVLDEGYFDLTEIEIEEMETAQ